MTEEIQLPTIINHAFMPISCGIYVLQFANAASAGFPTEWQFSHKEWLSVEQYGLIKIGFTLFSIEQRAAEFRRLAYWNAKEPVDISCVGYTDTYQAQDYEIWIHHTLKAFNISKKYMGLLGREWFIPTKEVLVFLHDVFEQLRSEKTRMQEADKERMLRHLAYIRQSHFGGVLTPPVIKP